MKFGGTSLGTPQRIKTVADLVIARLERKPMVVLSAFSGVTNALLQSARDAYDGKVDVLPLIRRHREACEELGVDKDLVTPLLLELKDLLKGISLVRELTPRSLDFVASFGERCSTRIVAEYFRVGRKVKARAYDAWDLGLVTDDHFTSASPLPDYEKMMRPKIDELPADEIPIVTGFVAKNRAGEITTVGRNGSDFSASIFGAATRAEEVQIWTDVDGVLTADPSLVKDARPIDVMTYHEAAELAYYGAKVLHPATLAPAVKRDIPVLVLNTMHPEAPGTRIVAQRTPAEAEAAGPVQSIVYKENQILLQITSPRMLMQYGFMARVFEILARHEVVINMIVTSEVTISMTTDSMKGLNEALGELRNHSDATIETGKAIVGVVGQNIRETRGIGAQILTVMRDAGVNVEMISMGASKVNFTFLIDNSGIRNAVQALHDKLFPKG
ncbi:MAG: aspartate kinase [Planctomycetota bacterium]